MTPPPKPLMERVGVLYFRRRSERLPAPVAATDAIHELNDDERRALRSIERGAVVRSALAGAFSGALCAATEVWLAPPVPEGAGLLSSASLTHWAILGGVTLVASVGEIAFVMWDTLRSVHALAQAAGAELFGRDREQSDSALVDALARAALELPNPIVGPLGINSRRDASRTRLVLASIAYKAKVGVTSFLLKLVLRRVLGRVFVRSVVSSLLPFVAVPVTAMWNGLVTRWILREARLRAMGPSAVSELAGIAFSDAPPLSVDGRIAAMRAVAAAIVRTEDLHPNLVALLTSVSKRVGRLPPAELDDVGEFLRSLAKLSHPEQRLCLQVLATACIVDGRLTRRERQLYQDALSAAGRDQSLTGLEQLCAALVSGDGFADDVLRAM
jgi:hypothetical protein